MLNRAYNVFNLISAANTNPYLQKIQEEETPRITAVDDALFLNDTIFKKVSYLYAHRRSIRLDGKSEFLLGYYMQKFMLAGVALSKAKKDSIKVLNAEEATLGAQFNRMVLNDTNNNSVLFTNPDEVPGLPPEELQVARQRAEEAQHASGWLIELRNYTQQNDLSFLKNRDNLGIAATAAMIEEARGREPFVIGKPSPVMMRSAVIGDTMEMDIIGGIYMGFKTILVLSGIADKDELIKYGYRPHVVVDSVDEIEFPLK